MNPNINTITTKAFPQVAYRRLGEGPAIMLLHGFPASGILWEAVLPDLSKEFTLLIPDVPGAGESRLDGEEVSMDKLAEIVPAILDHAGIEHCVLAGHSMGGYIGLAVAELFPERLTGLSLVHSTAKADDEERKEKRRKSIELIRKGGKEPFIRGMVPGLFSEGFGNAQPDKLRHWIDEGLKLAPQSIIAFYTAMMLRPDRREVVKHAPFPVQWIVGAHDSLIPPQNVLAQTALAAISQVSLFTESGHMAMVEESENLTAELRSFILYCVKHRTLEGAFK